MSRLEQGLSRFLNVCIVTFVIACFVLIAINFPPVAIVLGLRMYAVLFPLSVVAIILSAAIGMAGFIITALGHSRATAKSRTGPIRRIEAKIFSVFRTDRGKVVDAMDTELTKPAYHAVLVTADNKRFEVDTDAAVWQNCIEGSWGYAEIQGDWMGSYVRDADLYRKYTGR